MLTNQGTQPFCQELELTPKQLVYQLLLVAVHELEAVNLKLLHVNLPSFFSSTNFIIIIIILRKRTSFILKMKITVVMNLINISKIYKRDVLPQKAYDERFLHGSSATVTKYNLNQNIMNHPETNRFTNCSEDIEGYFSAVSVQFHPVDKKSFIYYKKFEYYCQEFVIRIFNRRDDTTSPHQFWMEALWQELDQYNDDVWKCKNNCHYIRSKKRIIVCICFLLESIVTQMKTIDVSQYQRLVRKFIYI